VKRKILSLLLSLAMLVGMTSSLSGCGDAKVDAFVVMIEQPDGVFNPYYSTSASDGTIVSMTQISMLSSEYADGEVKVAYGENHAVVTKDYDVVENDNDTTTYTFVLKNGILFSDGQPLTMEDVLFNFYVYLDPVYTGSNTLYSTDIVGLKEYRTQPVGSTTGDGDSLIASQADTRAEARINELVNLFNAQLKASPTKEVSYEDMKAAILAYSVSSGYQSAVSSNPSEVNANTLLMDYETTLRKFKEELGDDYVAAQDSYNDEPYKSHAEFKNEIFKFMFTEGYVEVKYAEGADGKVDRTKIKELIKSYPSTITTKQAAIDYVYNDMIARQLDVILYYSVTASELKNDYAAKAREIILHESAADGELVVPNIAGIVSLGHTDQAGETITVGETEYVIASDHNPDGTVVNPEEHDVLQITINGVDPKAIWNFAVTVAPQHYYGEGSKVGMDIKNNKFGVEYASFEFMSGVIQSPRNVRLPMGAGPYTATDSASSNTPKDTDFFKSNIAYFKRNTHFHTVGEEIENANIELLRYQVVSSNNAIGALQTGSVHYISPALTNENYEKLMGMSNDGYRMITTDQLGYGYIGVNAAKVKDINLRRAIMSAMNTKQSLSYYRAGTAEAVYWNMSKVSWAYPETEDNGHDYPMSGPWSEDLARANVQKYMDAAGVSPGSSELRVTFTIAGASLQDHPTYTVFRDAAALLNSMGWEVTVVCDTHALTKISTGSLAVWAAAWSSALDPDMYQVYHKDSSATSVKAWGYPHIKNSGSSEELGILDDLSELIDLARETNDQDERKELYEEAMGYILDLAVELPVYQRDVLYAYNSKVIDPNSLPVDVNPYSSPLDRIWELKFTAN